MTARILRPTDEFACWACASPAADISGAFARAPDGTPLHGVLLCRTCHADAINGGAVRLQAVTEGTFRVVRLE